MEFVIPNFQPAYPEIVLLGLISTVLLIDLFVPAEKRVITWALSLLSLAITGAVIYAAGFDQSALTFDGSYIIDPMSQLLKLFAVLSMALVFVYAKDYLETNGLTKGEFYTLSLFG
ncbi:MAG: NADH:ubiquinone oxidoreductase subunit N, partial [Pseudomonadota bacterium]